MSLADHIVDPGVVRDILLLVNIDVDSNAVQGWTYAQRKQAVEWAGAVHLRASDNEDVPVPPMPEFLNPYHPQTRHESNDGSVSPPNNSCDESTGWIEEYPHYWALELTPRLRVGITHGRKNAMLSIYAYSARVSVEAVLVQESFPMDAGLPALKARAATLVREFAATLLAAVEKA